MDAITNFAYSTVAVPPSPASTGTSLTVKAGDGARFPAPPFNAPVWAAHDQPLFGNAEILRVTAIAGDVLTFLRTQETADGASATPRAIQAGDQIAAPFTAKLVRDIASALALMAPIDSPAFTGTPTAPTPAPGEISTVLATAAFVIAARVLASSDSLRWTTGLPTAPVDVRLRRSAGKTLAIDDGAGGNATLSAAQILTTTAAPGDNSLQAATTAFVMAALAAGAAVPGAHHTTHEPGGADAITALSAAILTSGTLPDARLSAAIARLASPAFTGTPTAPTPTAADSSTKLATTAFVAGAVAGGGASGVWTNYTPTVSVNNGTITLNTVTSCAYVRFGATLTITFYLTVAVSGGPTQIVISMPAGFAATRVAAAGMYINAAGFGGQIQVVGSSNMYCITTTAGGSPNANGTYAIAGTATFECTGP